MTRQRVNPNTQMRVVSTWDELNTIASSWDRLWKKSPCLKTEFYSFQFVQRVATQESRGYGDPWCLVVEDEKQITAIVPLYSQWDFSTRLRVPVKIARFMPSPFIFRQAALCESNDMDVIHKLFNVFTATPHLHQLALTGLDKQSARAYFEIAHTLGLSASVLRVNQAHGAQPGSAAVDRCGLSLLSSWNDFYESRGRNYRKVLQKKRNRLTRNGRYAYWRLTGGEQLEGQPRTPSELVNLILKIDEHTWQHDKGVHLSRHGRKYLTDIVLLAYESQSLDISFLFIDDIPVAYTFGFVRNNHFRMCNIGFNRNFREYSPGFLLLAWVIETSMEHTPLKHLDFGGSNHEYKKSLASVYDSGYELVIYNANLLGKLTFFIQKKFSKHRKFSHV